MNWLGPSLDADQKDLAAMLDALAADRGSPPGDDPAATADLVRTLTELGVWTLGSSEQLGGGGADHVMTTVALERLGRHWPGLGWASVQAHAAVVLPAADPTAQTDIEAIHAGDAGIAVVEAGAEHVDLVRWRGGLRGEVARVTAACEQPGLVVITGSSSALFVRPSGITTRAMRTTGLDDGLSRHLTIDAAPEDVVALAGADVAAARRLLFLGGAAIAVGIAGAAAAGAHAYATQRQQFGGPLTAIPTVRANLTAQRAAATVTLPSALADVADPYAAHAIADLACASAIDVAASALQ
ncbi:MAG: acyl-CoA dehydrogenase family protein, partial [Actinomycetes bacterium]